MPVEPATFPASAVSCLWAGQGRDSPCPHAYDTVQPPCIPIDGEDPALPHCQRSPTIAQSENPPGSPPIPSRRASIKRQGVRTGPQDLFTTSSNDSPQARLTDAALSVVRPLLA